MKSSFLSRLVFVLFISLMGSSCTMDEYLNGIIVEGVNGVVKKEVKGVEFTFSLLDDQGNPANVFREGENFSFQFRIKNKTQQSLPFYDYGFYNTYDFLNVRSGETYLGKPMDFLYYSTTPEIRQIECDEAVAFIVPWQEQRSEFQMMYGTFKGLQQPFLPKGKYFTKFTYNFKFSLPDKEPLVETGKITFFVNFEVK